MGQALPKHEISTRRADAESETVTSCAAHNHGAACLQRQDPEAGRIDLSLGGKSLRQSPGLVSFNKSSSFSSPPRS